MTTTHLQRLLATAAFTSLATAAQAQVALQCPPGAGLGDAATPLTMYTGADGTWEKRYGIGGTWEPATTGNKHPAWYPGGGNAPANGSWLMPAPYPTTVTVPTTDPFYYRSPVIQVDGQVDEASIQVKIQQSTDNTYVATGIVNNGTEQYVAYSGLNNFAALSAPFSPALTWAPGPNRLLLHTQNTEPAYVPPTSSPTGVYAIINITATCKAQPSPPASNVQAVPADNPWALLLASAGLIALGARHLRRSRSSR